MNKDTIYRQDAINAVSEACGEWRGIFARCEEKLLILPPAETSIMTVKIDIDKEHFARAWKQALANSPLTAISAKPDTEEWIGGELGHTSKCGHEGCSSDIWDRCKNFYCPNCGRKVIWR